MKRFLKKQKDWVVGPNNSLRNKIIKDSFKYFIIYFLIFHIIIYAYYYITYNSFDLILNKIQANILSAVITFVIIMFSFKVTLRKHLLKRFDEFSEDMREIKKGDLSKRLNIKSFDEIDELAYFTNSVLDEFEKKLEFEKKYALMDPLTLCYNRRALNLSFAKFASRAERGEKINLSCALFDIDNFKTLNDTYGHDIGDKVLKELAKVIKDVLRKEDNLYRVGGEEFLILFFKLPKTKEKVLIERLRKEITYKLRKKLPKVKQKITVSGGFVNSKEYDLSNEETLDKMVKDADDLLYKAKKSGKDKILFK